MAILDDIRAERAAELKRLVAEATSFFDTLTPEQQAAHREAQKQSWVRGEMAMGESSMSAPRQGSRRRYLDVSSAERKRMPMAAGLLDYFTDALAAVAEVSHAGNEKHNPGEPVHHARGKSTDHADCIMRHLAERGGHDPEGNRHSAQLAWRALALLQEELEAEYGFPLPRGARAAE